MAIRTRLPLFLLALAALAGCHHYRGGYSVDDITPRPARVTLELATGRVVELLDAVRAGDTVIGYGTSAPRVRSTILVEQVQTVRIWRLNRDALVVGVLTAMAIALALLGYLAGSS